MSGSFIYRHHVEPRVELYSPREESFPIPLKYIDVTRTTHTNLDVKLEKRIDDYWNIDGSRDLSDPWTGFTQFTLLDEKAPDGYTWSGGRLTRKQLTSRPDHLWPELWKSMGKNAKLKEKQKWSEEKRQAHTVFFYTSDHGKSVPFSTALISLSCCRKGDPSCKGTGSVGEYWESLLNDMFSDLSQVTLLSGLETQTTEFTPTCLIDKSLSRIQFLGRVVDTPVV